MIKTVKDIKEAETMQGSGWVCKSITVIDGVKVYTMENSEKPKRSTKNEK